jgi:hypothetical protein
MTGITLPLIEEVFDSISVIAVVTSAVYWWKASHASYAAADSNPLMRARLNAKAATYAAVAATLQALAVLAHVFEVANQF